MKTRLTLSVLSISAAFLVTACCPKNPELNTAISAHGNTDWHIDTAEEFLFGTDMAGNTTATNHCPNSWTRRHMHVGKTNTNHYYYDKDLTTPGDDANITDGIDRAMLFFYAGHGSPTLWNTLGNNASQDHMRLGDCPGNGLLRYYWQCSCEVFAHGPRSCPGATFHYACPGSFDGSADSFNMRNVYERWGPALDPDLRMACGASTSAYCHETQTNQIWEHYNVDGYDVADSFIYGLDFWGVVPLCITMGGPNVTTTPLYDSKFTNQPNTSGTSHYHIQYLSQFDSAPRWKLKLPAIPPILPIYELKPMPMPRRFSRARLSTAGDFMVSSDVVEERGPRMKVSRLSGAVYVVGKRDVSGKGPVLKEADYVEQARSFIQEQGWMEESGSDLVGAKFEIESAPVNGKRGDTKRTQKNIVASVRRAIDVEGVPVPVLGEGGIISLQLNNDGSVFNARKVWRQISGVKRQAPIKSYEEAHKEAFAKLKYPREYKLDQWTWGYKEAAGSVSQTEMRIVFRFMFIPVDPGKTLEHPPRMIEIPGQT